MPRVNIDRQHKFFLKDQILVTKYSVLGTGSTAAIIRKTWGLF